MSSFGVFEHHLKKSVGDYPHVVEWSQNFVRLILTYSTWFVLSDSWVVNFVILLSVKHLEFHCFPGGNSNFHFFLQEVVPFFLIKTMFFSPSNPLFFSIKTMVYPIKTPWLFQTPWFFPFENHGFGRWMPPFFPSDDFHRNDVIARWTSSRWRVRPTRAPSASRRPIAKARPATARSAADSQEMNGVQKWSEW